MARTLSGSFQTCFKYPRFMDGKNIRIFRTQTGFMKYKKICFKKTYFFSHIVSIWKEWPVLNYAILMSFVSVCVTILWRILGGVWTRWKCQGERAMEIVNPEQWDWAWNHYIRRTMCGGTESPSATAVILIAKQGQSFSSRETIISSMFQPLAIILSEHECRMLSLLARLRVFLSQSHQGIILLSVICKSQADVTKSQNFPAFFSCFFYTFVYTNKDVFICWSTQNSMWTQTIDGCSCS